MFECFLVKKVKTKAMSSTKMTRKATTQRINVEKKFGKTVPPLSKFVSLFYSKCEKGRV